VSIRAGTADDIAAVLPLVAKTIAFHEQLDPARWAAVPKAHERYQYFFERVLSNNGVFLVVEEAGAIIGFLLGAISEEYAMYRAGRYGMLHDLWIEPDHRRKGHARALLMAALDQFRREGLKQVRLDSAAGNHVAQKLFRSCGFRPSVIEMLTEL
jgi:ribosomal protein S18 acetylase RimI-like enzyme